MPTTKKMKPPKSLISPVVVALWNKLVKHLGPLHVLAVTDEEALLHLCNLHAHCAKLWDAGETPTATRSP